MKVKDCSLCVDYLVVNYQLLEEAAATVALDKGNDQSITQLMVGVLSMYHNAGHVITKI
jgi:hypothetical protein